MNAKKEEKKYWTFLCLQVDVVVFVLSPISDELEALGRAGINTPKIPQSGVAR